MDSNSHKGLDLLVQINKAAQAITGLFNKITDINEPIVIDIDQINPLNLTDSKFDNPVITWEISSTVTPIESLIHENQWINSDSSGTNNFFTSSSKFRENLKLSTLNRRIKSINDRISNSNIEKYIDLIEKGEECLGFEIDELDLELSYEEYLILAYEKIEIEKLRKESISILKKLKRRSQKKTQDKRSIINVFSKHFYIRNQKEEDSICNFYLKNIIKNYYNHIINTHDQSNIRKHRNRMQVI